jgi:cell division protein FtsN
MDKIIKILLAVILVFVTFLWLSTIFKSCNKPKSDLGNIPKEEIVDNPTPNDDFFETDPSNEDSTYFEYDEENQEKNIYDEIDKIAEDRQKSTDSNNSVETQKPEAKESTANQEDTKEKSKKPIPNSSAKYLVLTGSFLIEKNAEDAVLKLKKIGFSGAEKVVFDNSEYYSTIAGRTNDYKSASELCNKLKSNGYKDCIIKEKK